MTARKELEALLLEMESQLRSSGLWDLQAPDPCALSSELPFSHDTLKFHQWLQWIFLPRTRMLIRNQSPLPGPSDIHSMAELYCQSRDIEASDLLTSIKAIDQIFSAGIDSAPSD